MRLTHSWNFASRNFADFATWQFFLSTLYRGYGTLASNIIIAGLGVDPHMKKLSAIRHTHNEVILLKFLEVSHCTHSPGNSFGSIITHFIANEAASM